MYGYGNILRVHGAENPLPQTTVDAPPSKLMAVPVMKRARSRYQEGDQVGKLRGLSHSANGNLALRGDLAIEGNRGRPAPAASTALLFTMPGRSCSRGCHRQRTRGECLGQVDAGRAGQRGGQCADRRCLAADGRDVDNGPPPPRAFICRMTKRQQRIAAMTLSSKSWCQA